MSGSDPSEKIREIDLTEVDFGAGLDLELRVERTSVSPREKLAAAESDSGDSFESEAEAARPASDAERQKFLESNIMPGPAMAKETAKATEDIAQQVFAKVYFSIRNFDFRSSLLTWIYKITVNECYDYLRKKRVRKLVYESDFSQEDAQRMEASEPAVDREVLADTRLANRDLVVQLLSKVSEEDRNLILLKEVEGHSVEELAGMTGMMVKQGFDMQKTYRLAMEAEKVQPVPWVCTPAVRGAVCQEMSSCAQSTSAASPRK